MPLAKPIPALRQDLQDLLVEDLPATLKALKELLPEASDKHTLVAALQSRLQQLNKDRIRGIIDPGEYARRLAGISADCYDLINDLEPADFEVKHSLAKATASKQGSVLYHIPRKMILSKPSICTICVAVDEDAILEDIVLNDDTRLRQRVEVSDRMSAELIDTEGNVFDIVDFNPAQQKVRNTGYTKWLFRVTPRVEGIHQLLVKVSLLEFDSNTNEYISRDVSIMETVTIVTEALSAEIWQKGTAPSDSDELLLKFSGYQFSLGPQNPMPSNLSKSKSPHREKPHLEPWDWRPHEREWERLGPWDWHRQEREWERRYEDYRERRRDRGSEWAMLIFVVLSVLIYLALSR